MRVLSYIETMSCPVLLWAIYLFLCRCARRVLNKVLQVEVVKKKARDGKTNKYVRFNPGFFL